ncbi:MAG: hypothetical protein LBI03_06240 [Clostridiales bacterium]|jgi:hypothetical protein|nr:hypothetical protein [Clostridiales bacterium]
MPNAELQTIKISTPRSSGLSLMERVNAMYQSGYIDSDCKTKTTKMILSGMNTGDYTELYGHITEQCSRTSADNPFWDQMKEILSKEAIG